MKTEKQIAAAAAAFETFPAFGHQIALAGLRMWI